MNDEELVRLERIAKTAMPVLWIRDCRTWPEPYVSVLCCMEDEIQNSLEDSEFEAYCTNDVGSDNNDILAGFEEIMADANFLEAVTPEKVLQMIQEIRSLRKTVAD